VEKGSFNHARDVSGSVPQSAPNSSPFRILWKTELKELTLGKLIHIGACVAAKYGMGGVWFPDKGPTLLWRFPLPLPVQEKIVSYDNLTGQLTNYNLELAGTVVHQAILGTPSQG
jgi:hypothetical protein